MPETAPRTEDSLRLVNDDIASALGAIPAEVFDFRRSPFIFMGKAARARFTLLTAEALGADAPRARKAAAAAELIHTASLLHDDCIDTARFRRGLPTLYSQLGVNSAILVGDLLTALSFGLAGQAAPELQPELAHAVRRMTEGALIEENSRGKKISAAEAGRIASMKTGALFRWCALSVCHLAGRQDLLADCARIGEATGSAFQIIDDVLDFEGDPADCGKETLKDIKEGKSTLPLILALNDPKAAPEAEKLMAEINSGPAADLSPALALAALVRKGGFAAAAREKAGKDLGELLPLTDKFPCREGSAALKDFLLALGERRA